MEIKVMSEHRIKPSKPTPTHLKTYKNSLLDQLLSSEHVPILFFYLNEKNISDHNTIANIISEKSNNLKKSLSETLTRFYPLAGKVKDHELCIDCNDDGVHYIETRVNCDLTQFLKDPDFNLTRQLVPNTPNYSDSEAGFDVVIVQVNFFNCGGVGLSMSTSHKILDGTTLACFCKDWGITAQGSSKMEPPSFVAPTLFPQNKLLPKDTTLCMWPSMFKGRKCVTKRFFFDSKSLFELKKKIASSNIVHNPTRVQSVFSLIWKCAYTASEKNYGSKYISSVLTLAVDIRRRSNPPLPKFTAGNLIWSGVAECTHMSDTDTATLVERMREAISKNDTDFCNGVRGEDGYIKVNERLSELEKVYSNENTYYFSCTSLCSSGIYNTDFGWGKPVWVCLGLEDEPLNIYLIDTCSGNGFEAWVSLPEEDMVEFEKDPEIVAFSHLNPSPLKLIYPGFQLN